MEPYEMTYIVRPDLDEEQIRGVIDDMNRRLGGGGEVIATYPWNPPRRRMAYPIRDFGDGYYVTATFNFPPQELRELERGLRLNNNILRFLVVQATPNNIQQSQQRAQQHAARLAGVQPGAPSSHPGPAAPQPAGTQPPPGTSGSAPAPVTAPTTTEVEQVQPEEPPAPAPQPAAATTETQE